MHRAAIEQRGTGIVDLRAVPTRGPLLDLALAIGLVVCLLSGAALAAKKTEKPDVPEITSYYATTFGRTGGDFMLVHYWSNGSLFRSETIVTGHPIVTIVNGDHYYMYDALLKRGFAIKRSKATVAADAKRTRPFANDFEDLLEAGGEQVKSEEMNGVSVDVYRVTDETGRRTLWVSPDELKLPLRLESYDRHTGRTGVVDWINWSPGIQIPDGFFEPEAGIEFERFESYQAYLERLRKGPVGPAPPFYHYLLHQREKGDAD